MNETYDDFLYRLREQRKQVNAPYPVPFLSFEKLR